MTLLSNCPKCKTKLVVVDEIKTEVMHYRRYGCPNSYCKWVPRTKKLKLK